MTQIGMLWYFKDQIMTFQFFDKYVTLVIKITTLTFGSNGDGVLPMRNKITSNHVPDHWDLF
jgi:hypothetical protein